MLTSGIADAITAAGSISTNPSSSVSNMTVDTETFLKLLVAQLQYQDPLEPQSDTEFVTQLAQMSTLESMNTMTESMSSIQAYGLVGKYAYAEQTNPDSGETECIYGTVDSIYNSAGEFYAIIDSEAVELGSIIQVFDSALVNDRSALIESSGLIGKTITGTYTQEDGTAIEISGIVAGVYLSGGTVYAEVSGERIALSDILSVSEAGTGDCSTESDTVTE